MHHVISIGLLFLLTTLASATAQARVEWTLLVYAGLDEEEIAYYGDPTVKQLLTMPLPDSLEVLVEHDTHGDTGVYRYVRRPGEKPRRMAMPEHDSADTNVFENFMRWADQESTGRRRVFLVMTHAWGWKGIVQDYTVPGRPEQDTMMPVREFARILRQSARPSDILFLDSCVLGNAEAIEELVGTARYIVASQRETPYNGYPYEYLFEMLSSTRVSTRRVARAIPAQYVEAYASGGSKARAEGEFDVVTAVTIDMAKWSDFTSLFQRYVAALARSNFRARLHANPLWPTAFADMDSNVDLIELLTRIPRFVEDPLVTEASVALLNHIGYPRQIFDRTAHSFRFHPDKAKYVELWIEADEHISAEERFQKTLARFKEANQGLRLPPHLKFRLDGRKFKVSGRVEAPLEIRAWLPGTSKVQVTYVDLNNHRHTRTFTRQRDYFVAVGFPESSFMVAEAHTQGAPFIHGIGLNMKPLMDASEERGTDPLTGLSGPDFYRSTRWNRLTGWGDLILLTR